MGQGGVEGCEEGGGGAVVDGAFEEGFVGVLDWEGGGWVEWFVMRWFVIPSYVGIFRLPIHPSHGGIAQLLFSCRRWTGCLFCSIIIQQQQRHQQRHQQQPLHHHLRPPSSRPATSSHYPSPPSPQPPNPVPPSESSHAPAPTQPS